MPPQLAPAPFPLVRQAGAAWEVHAGDDVLAVRDTYPEAVAFLADLAADEGAPTPSSDGLLPETWTGEVAIAYNEQPDPERDFTNVKWGWRDPEASLVPLMLQTSTEMGHFGAELAGFIQSFELTGTGEPNATGRFYDTEAGRTARGLLLGGRKFGVSVDPDSDTTADYMCIEEDDDGFCQAAMWSFTYYSIAGLTMTPFPAFARANIVLAGAETADSSAPEDTVEAALEGLVAASAARPDRRARPPKAWFTMPEPEFGDPLLVQQDLAGERWGVPLTITEEGHVFGHLALWGECLRVGREDVCIQPPDSARAYAEFMVCSTRTAEGELVATGAMVVGCPHYPVSGVDRSHPSVVRDYYAEAGLGWADVRASSGAFGPWITGRVRPDVTLAQLSVLQSVPPSGDWSFSPEDGGLELCAILSVNKPGYPVRREAIAAAALPADSLADGASVAAHLVGRTVMALTGANRVRPCPECNQRHAAAQTATSRELAALARIEALLRTIDRRTLHLNGAAMQTARARLFPPTIRD